MSSVDGDGAEAAANQRPCVVEVSHLQSTSASTVCPLSPAVIARVSQQAAAISALGRAGTCDGAARGSIRVCVGMDGYGYGYGYVRYEWIRAAVMRLSIVSAGSKKHTRMQQVSSRARRRRSAARSAVGVCSMRVVDCNRLQP